jgi:hypothetical protein
MYQLPRSVAFVLTDVTSSCLYRGLFKMIVGVLTTCHTNTLEIAVYVFFYLIEQLSKVFVTYLTGALHVHPL